MAAAKATLRVSNLPARKLSALRRVAERQGVTPEQYVMDLIDDDLSRMETASRTTFDEVAKPFREAFKGASDAELDALVDAARKRRRQRRQKSNGPRRTGFSPR